MATARRRNSRLVLLIGLGRLGKSLHRSFHDMGVDLQACSARPDQIQSFDLNHRLVLLCIPDQCIIEWVDALALLKERPKGVVIFSGSMQMEPLQERLVDVPIGRFHPLSSFTHRSGPLPQGLTFGISGSPELMDMFRGWAKKLGGSTLVVTDETAHDYHLAAVLASNFQAFFVRWGAKYLQKLEIDQKQALDALRPLVSQSIEHGLDWKQEYPYSGPAARNDLERIQTYFQTIKNDDEELAEVYRVLSAKISQANNS